MQILSTPRLPLTQESLNELQNSFNDKSSQILIDFFRVYEKMIVDGEEVFQMDVF